MLLRLGHYLCRKLVFSAQISTSMQRSNFLHFLTLLLIARHASSIVVQDVATAVGTVTDGAANSSTTATAGRTTDATMISSVDTAVGKTDEETVNSNEGLHLFQGDIRLTPAQEHALKASQSNQKAVVRDEFALWPNARVPYVLDGSLSSSARSVISTAIGEYHARTCIRFVPRRSEANYVWFFSGRGCYSYIGQTTGRQEISIGRGCDSIGTVIHEMFHALGRWHEQSRPDRDRFVKINYENIERGLEDQFDRLSSTIASTQGVPYDYQSVMHYSAYAFSRNDRPTIEPINSNIPSSSLGQRNGFSQRDIQHTRALYCSSPTGSWSNWGQWSPCSRTCGGGQRTRTRTCVGGSDCPGSGTQSLNCNTNSCPVVSWSSWSSWSACSASCGGGRQQRARTCRNGNTCTGSAQQLRNCNTQSCPTSPTGSWSNWGQWSPCSRTCGGGQRTRTRTCVGGSDCPGSGSQSQNCNANPCPTVSISVVYTHPADFNGGPNEYRAGSGPVIVTCTAGTGFRNGPVSYQWSSTCRNCPFKSATSRIVKRTSVRSSESGTHTCVATQNGITASMSIDFRVVGAGVNVFWGSPRGNLLNNGLVISESPGSGYRLRIFCRSDSRSRNVGELIGPSGRALTGDNFFAVARTHGEVKLENVVGSHNALTASEQGVYTCRIPVQSGEVKEINFGIYPSGFNTLPRIVALTGSSSNVICTSTGSPATTVTWKRNGQLLTAGSTYQMTQRVINRAASTYENVLTTNQPLTGVFFSCTVSNSLGTNTGTVLFTNSASDEVLIEQNPSDSSADVRVETADSVSQSSALSSQNCGVMLLLSNILLALALY